MGGRIQEITTARGDKKRRRRRLLDMNSRLISVDKKKEKEKEKPNDSSFLKRRWQDSFYFTPTVFMGLRPVRRTNQ